MLKKTERLSTKAFDEYFKTGRRTHGTYVQVVFSKANTFHGAVVVGKKVYKRAVDRNRLRRQLYAVLYEYRQHVGVYQVLVKPAAKSVSAPAVRAELRPLLAQLVQK